MEEADFQRLLDEAVKFHGHLCRGQVIGVRMAMAGLRSLGIKDPRSKEGMDLVIFVEIDRCATDAIISVTGRTPGKRSIKMMDYGKMAATFVNAATGEAVRIAARVNSNEKLKLLVNQYLRIKNESEADFAALSAIPEKDLLRIQNVKVDLRPEDLPGAPHKRVICESCGETVMDMREVCRDGKVLCKPCAEGEAYYVETTII